MKVVVNVPLKKIVAIGVITVGTLKVISVLRLVSAIAREQSINVTAGGFLLATLVVVAYFILTPKSRVLATVSGPRIVIRVDSVNRLVEFIAGVFSFMEDE